MQIRIKWLCGTYVWRTSNQCECQSSATEIYAKGWKMCLISFPIFIVPLLDIQFESNAAVNLPRFAVHEFGQLWAVDGVDFFIDRIFNVGANAVYIDQVNMAQKLNQSVWKCDNFSRIICMIPCGNCATDGYSSLNLVERLKMKICVNTRALHSFHAAKKKTE